MTETGSTHTAPGPEDEPGPNPQAGADPPHEAPPASTNGDAANGHHAGTPGMWDGDGPAPAEGPAPTEEPAENFHTAGPSAEQTRKPFQAVRIQPVDKNGNPIAGWGRRIGAFAIDWGFVAALEIAVLIVFGFARVGKIATYIDAAIAISYFTFSVGSPHGQTIGMHLTGIAVIDEETGDTPSYPKALLRFFLVSTFMAPAMIPLAVMFYFALFDGKREMVHDKAVGTVVIQMAYQPAPAPQGSVSPASRPAATPVSNGTASKGTPAPRRSAKRSHAPIDPIVKVLRKYGTRIAIVVTSVAVIAIVATVVVNQVSSANAYDHSPARAATAYLTALAQEDVPAMQASSGIVTPTDVPLAVNVLLSASDIKRELAQPNNAIGRISDVVVESIHTTKSGTATVTLSYHANNDVHSATYALISSETSPSGWLVQVTPARLDVTVPTGDTTATLDAMALTLDGQIAHVYLYPSVATVAVPASAIWQAASTTIDTRNEDPTGDPRQVSFPDQLLPAAQASAISAVTDQINACLAATSLTPPNCPNTDVPYRRTRATRTRASPGAESASRPRV